MDLKAMNPSVSNICLDSVIALVYKCLSLAGVDTTPFPESYSKMVKLIDEFVPDHHEYCICSVCETVGPLDSDIQLNEVCSNPNCSALLLSKSTKAPSKVLFYIPVIPRLRALHSVPTLAKILKHPNNLYPTADFAVFGKKTFEDTRTLHFVYSTDGLQPFHKGKEPYSIWPGCLILLNLPTAESKMAEHILLTHLTKGPNTPSDMNQVSNFVRI